MSNVRVELNHDGFRQFLNSSEVQQLVLSEAQDIASRATVSTSGSSEGFRAHSTKSGTRWIAFAGTTDKATVVAESESKVLSRAVIPHG